MEVEAEDFSMMVEEKEETGVKFSKMEMYFGNGENHVIDNLTNDGSYVTWTVFIHNKCYTVT